MSNARINLIQWSGIAVVGGLVLMVLAGMLFLPETYHFGTVITVSRTPEQVWAWFVRPNRWAKRFPMIQSIDGGSDEMTAVGAQHRLQIHLPGGKTLVSEIKITDFAKGRLYEDRHLGDWLDGTPLPITNVTDQLEFYRDGEGQTRITYTGVFEVKGLLNRWLAYFTLRPMADRVLAQVRNEYDRSIKKDHPSPTS